MRREDQEKPGFLREGIAMAFIAECPFCHVKLQGVPHELAGSSTQCPKCRNLFTLSASTDVAEEPAVGPRRLLRRRASVPGPTLAFVPPKALETAPPEPRRGDWTHVKPAPPPQPADQPSAAPAPVAPPKKTFPAGKPRTLNTLGIASLLAGGLALLAAALPTTSDLCLPLAGVGLVFAILGGISWLLNNNGIGYAAGGLAVSGLLLLVAVVRPTLLGLNLHALDSWEWGLPAQTLVVSDSATTGGRVSIANAEWIDATRGAIEQDDFRVRIKSALIKPSIFEQEKNAPPQKSLVIQLRVDNVSSKRKIAYKSWGEVYPGNVPVLKDNLGNAYRSLGSVTDMAEYFNAGLLAPGKSFEDALTFEAPRDGIESLRLELPAAAIGSRGRFRLLIPKSMIAAP
jgi:hypothetical protein